MKTTQLKCFECKKPVSSPIPNDPVVIVRGIVTCPECIEKTMSDLTIDWKKSSANVAPRGEAAANDLIEAIDLWLKKHCKGEDSSEPWDLAYIAREVVLEVALVRGMLRRANGLQFQKKDGHEARHAALPRRKAMGSRNRGSRKRAQKKKEV